MKMIVGLGNPGPKYQLNRHNIGFLLIDVLRGAWGDPHVHHQSEAEVFKTNFGGSQVLLVKPQTFMNLSGQSVQPLMHFYRIEKQNLLVVHDEIDLDFGTMKFHSARGHGGHNGVRDIHSKIGEDYGRLKLGVSRPPPESQMDVAAWCLQNFPKDQHNELENFLVKAQQAVECFVQDGFIAAQNKFNTKEK